jgi:hypothetical protein
MTAIEELGYTTRALFLFNEKHNQLGTLADFGLMPLEVFQDWESRIYQPVRKAMVARNLKAKTLVIEGDFPRDGKATDYDGKKLTLSDDMKSASKQELYAHTLKLTDIDRLSVVSMEPGAIQNEEDKAYVACTEDQTFDVEIMNSDEYKKL